MGWISVSVSVNDKNDKLTPSNYYAVGSNGPTQRSDSSKSKIKTILFSILYGNSGHEKVSGIEKIPNPECACISWTQYEG